MFTKSALALSVLTATLTLAGCDGEEPSTDDVHDYVEQETKSQTMESISKEEVELKKSLEELHRTDPSVKDLYYSSDENGGRQLHVVRDAPTKESASSVSETVWPILGGVAAGALVSHMISSGGVSNYTRSNPPFSDSYYSQEDQRKKKNEYTSGYVNSMVAQNRTRLYASPGLSSNVRAAVSSRSSGVFASSSSARSGGYGMGS
jgi:PBP1b-binding outer membrane lipoprotein LpoB